MAARQWDVRARGHAGREGPVQLRQERTRGTVLRHGGQHLRMPLAGCDTWRLALGGSSTWQGALHTPPRGCPRQFLLIPRRRAHRSLPPPSSGPLATCGCHPSSTHKTALTSGCRTGAPRPRPACSGASAPGRCTHGATDALQQRQAPPGAWPRGGRWRPGGVGGPSRRVSGWAAWVGEEGSTAGWPEARGTGSSEGMRLLSCERPAWGLGGWCPHTGPSVHDSLAEFARLSAALATLLRLSGCVADPLPPCMSVRGGLPLALSPPPPCTHMSGPAPCLQPRVAYTAPSSLWLIILQLCRVVMSSLQAGRLPPTIDQP